MSGLSDFDFPFINNPDSANMLNQLKQFRAKTKAFYEESDAILRDYETRIAALDDSMTSHTHTKASIGLGNVDNYATATQAEAEAGSVNDKFMTPLRTKQAVDKLSIPAGCVAYFAMSSAPSGWLKCNGAAVSRATYAALFAAIGTTFGAGDGSTTFNLPDLRGEFVRGWDDSRGVDSGRAMGSAQADAFQGHWHQGYGNDNANGGFNGNRLGDTTNCTYTSVAFIRDAVTDGTRGTPRVAAETRPRNIALLACIKV